MKYHPLSLQVHRPDWSASGGSRPFSSDIDADRARIWERDDHTCQCCGFRSEKYQQVYHKNGYDTDFTDDNCLTTCIFCHQCFDLNAVGAMNSGVLIWLPEIGQAALHHIMRAVYIARITQGPMGEAARAAIKALKERREDARKRLGTDDPEALAIVMQDFLSHKQYDRVPMQLKGIRLLPLDRRQIKDGDLDFNEFPQILAYWRSKNGPLGEFPVNTWGPMLHTLKNA